MPRTLFAIITVSLLCFSASASGQALNACDLNSDGVVDDVDVNTAVQMTLGFVPCTADIVGANICNVFVVQRVINAIDGTCATGPIHSATLNWEASTSPNVVGYRVYRGEMSGGAYILLNPTLVSGATYVDATVAAGQTYYYVVTAVDSGNNESVYSNEAPAVIPSP